MRNKILPLARAITNVYLNAYLERVLDGLNKSAPSAMMRITAQELMDDSKKYTGLPINLITSNGALVLDELQDLFIVHENMLAEKDGLNRTFTLIGFQVWDKHVTTRFYEVKLCDFNVEFYGMGVLAEGTTPLVTKELQSVVLDDIPTGML